MSSAQPETPALAAATAMFVEVLVVGIGFVTGLALLAAAAAGPETTARAAPVAGSTPAAGAGLAAAYALGILIDRAADKALAPVRRRLRQASFPTDAAYAQARLTLAEQPTLVALADYARSRMRICRGWILNTALLTLAGDLALLRYHVEHRPLLLTLTTALGLALTAGFYLSWNTITATGYRKLAQQTMTLTTPAVPAQGNTAPTTPAPPG
ncbi:hypothetical protein PO587_38760 [Streptomyces gilvifuscus]|uniref:Integral membrane protein n=1 Tax=Streptomyces gilvifuscus TaxID=1550617 RepID=A0ABT5G6C0_9ACTN|nr:hypothetical protein [Streptomyces gilvifuscus]MDC2960384.1 hypothetical protein [Streptomyces gilvifuscus]